MHVTSVSFDSARYFPAACAGAHRPFLVRVGPDDKESARPICPDCGLLGRFIPSANYSSDYRSKVEAVIEVLESASLGHSLACDCLTRLERLLPRPTPSELKAAFSEIQALESLQDLVPPTFGDANQHRNFLALVLALLSVYADADRAAPRTNDAHAAANPRRDVAQSMVDEGASP